MKEVAIKGYFIVNGANPDSFCRRYNNALDYANVQLIDAPYMRFNTANMATNGTVVEVSVSRKNYTEFDDVPEVDMDVYYKFEGAIGTFSFRIRGEEPYMAATWITDDLEHAFLSSGRFKALDMKFEGAEAGD